MRLLAGRGGQEETGWAPGRARGSGWGGWDLPQLLSPAGLARRSPGGRAALGGPGRPVGVASRGPCPSALRPSAYPARAPALGLQRPAASRPPPRPPAQAHGGEGAVAAAPVATGCGRPRRAPAAVRPHPRRPGAARPQGAWAGSGRGRGPRRLGAQRGQAAPAWQPDVHPGRGTPAPAPLPLAAAEPARAGAGPGREVGAASPLLRYSPGCPRLRLDQGPPPRALRGRICSRLQTRCHRRGGPGTPPHPPGSPNSGGVPFEPPGRVPQVAPKGVGVGEAQAGLDLLLDLCEGAWACWSSKLQEPRIGGCRHAL